MIEPFSESQIKEIDCGHYHSLALLENGSLFSWGWASFQGTINTGSGYYDIFPTRVGEILLNKKITQVAGGRRHSCVITEDKEIYTWGIGENGQLGMGDTENRNLPTLISSIRDIDPVKIKCGWGHNLLLTEEGNVYTWGFGESGCLGLGDLKTVLLPKELKELRDIRIVDIEAGSDFSLFLDDQGNVYYTGNLESKKKMVIKSPEILKFKDSNIQISKISAGLSHSLFISTRGDLYSFGWNSDGQLGVGTNEPIEGPVHVSSIDKRVKLMGCGRVHSVCITEENTIFTWGNASRGRLGNGQIESELLPSQMDDPEIEGNILSVSCGQDHTLLLSEVC